MAARKIYDNSSEKKFFVKLIGLTWFLVRTAFNQNVVINSKAVKEVFTKEQRVVEEYVAEHLDELNTLAADSDD